MSIGVGTRVRGAYRDFYGRVLVYGPVRPVLRVEERKNSITGDTDVLYHCEGGVTHSSATCVEVHDGMVPGQTPYSEEELAKKDSLMRGALEAEEEFDLDELERYARKERQKDGDGEQTA